MLDYHNHLERGSLTREYLLKFIHQAQERGIEQVGISEHSYLFTELLPLYEGRIGDARISLGRQQRRWFEERSGRWSLVDYFQLLMPLREEYNLRIGLELDYFPGSEGLVRELLDSWPWDYIIGSVHWIDGWVYDIWPDTWNGRDVGEVWRRYLEIAQEGASSGCFDILGHSDSIKIFGFYPFPWPREEFAELARALARKGVAAEVNTAFCHRGHSRNFCPDPKVLEIFHKHGVAITFGSDAHEPGEAGLLLSKAQAYANRCGYSSYLGFDRRRPVKYKL